MYHFGEITAQYFTNQFENLNEEHFVKHDQYCKEFYY